MARNDAIYMAAYENAAIYSQGTRNAHVHDTIMHAPGVAGQRAMGVLAARLFKKTGGQLTCM